MASVKVAVRVRPFNKRELNMGSKLVVDVHGSQVVLDAPPPSASATPSSSDSGSGPSRPHKFTFDFSYWSHNRNDSHFASQEKVFNDLGMDVVENAFNGYNVCVFAYGQTGSGKTYTMMGNDNDEDSCNQDELGLIPRICQTMFAKMQTSTESNTTFRTEASYLEIYNERVKDLLGQQSSGDQHSLKVREHPKEGPYVENLSKHLVMDYGEIKNLMERGNAVRTTAATNMNDTSSRSHAIFTVTFVKAGFTDGLPHETVSKIHLVDLAGSERANASGATGKRLKEGGHINKSLVTLGSVISALAEASSKSHNNNKKVFIPYRDSVLTWLLKDSLGGNSKTIMIATISPAEVNHNETLSTLRYANRAKNIINKPTVNEDPNVKLIRELRAEIDRLRTSLTTESSVDLIDPNAARKKLAVKEAQERHLTEEWTEKWKEAAKILDEHKALALKATGVGVSLDSDKPHLVGIDEDVMATGITLYQLKEGETHIGSAEDLDIVLKTGATRAGIQPKHCVINLKDGIATLIPLAEDAMCMINSVTVNQPTRLYQGCVILLGKTSMFRYNDPKEAANMRLNLSNGQHQHHLQSSFLSQSLSDLRSSPSTFKNSTPIRKRSSHAQDFNVNHLSNGDLQEELSNCCGGGGGGRLSSPDSMHTMTPDGSEQDNQSSSAEMGKLYEAISEQKDVIMKCLESDQCDISGLNEQLGILQTMQQKYSKLEYEHARSLWMAGVRHLGDGDSSEVDYEDQFNSLVEQEVERRMFQEKVLKAESEFQERELQKMERERELASIKRQHDREIYMLKRKLAETSLNSRKISNAEQTTASSSLNHEQENSLSVTIPNFTLSGLGSNAHVEYQVNIRTVDAAWTVMRRFRQFRDLHVSMQTQYGNIITALPFPSRRIFGNRSDYVSGERQKQLMIYLNVLLLTLIKIESCPLYCNPKQNALLKLSSFFHQDAKEAIDSDEVIE